MPRRGEGQRPGVIAQRHERRFATAQRVHEQYPRVARHREQVAPPRRGDVPSCRDRPARRRLIGGGGDQLRGVDGDEPLIGGAEQLMRQARQRLCPRDPQASRERHHAALRVHREQRAVGPQGRLLDRRRDRVHAGAAQVDGEDLTLGGQDVEEFRLGVESDHPADRRELAAD